MATLDDLPSDILVVIWNYLGFVEKRQLALSIKRLSQRSEIKKYNMLVRFETRTSPLLPELVRSKKQLRYPGVPYHSDLKDMSKYQVKKEKIFIGHDRIGTIYYHGDQRSRSRVVFAGLRVTNLKHLCSMREWFESRNKVYYDERYFVFYFGNNIGNQGPEMVRWIYLHTLSKI